MKLNSLSDMARSFNQSRANTDIRTRLATLTNELSTGKVSDLTARLGGDTTVIRDIDRQLTLGRTQSRAVTEAAQWTDAIQTRLGRIDEERAVLSESLLRLTPDPLPEERALASAAGMAAFDAIVTTLNGRLAGQALFAGRATDATALASADDMMTNLRTAAAGATSAADVIAAVDTWFDTAGGGFETSGYGGDATGQISRRVAEDLTITPGIRADDPTLRATMKAAALAALAEDPVLSLTGTDRTAILKDASARALDLGTPLTGMRATLGQQEGLIERQQANLAARIAALSITRNEADGADPFDTASGLQEVQIQLETHYAVTARLSQLTLTNYLR